MARLVRHVDRLPISRGCGSAHDARKGEDRVRTAIMDATVNLS